MLHTYLSNRYNKPLPIEDALKIMPKIGQTLPNGAILLDEHVLREFDHRRDSLVLCVAPSPYTPFASWHRLVTTDSPLATGDYQIVDTCVWGEYSRTLDEAMTMFADRITKRTHALEV